MCEQCPEQTRYTVSSFARKEASALEICAGNCDDLDEAKRLCDEAFAKGHVLAQVKDRNGRFGGGCGPTIYERSRLLNGYRLSGWELDADVPGWKEDFATRELGDCLDAAVDALRRWPLVKVYEIYRDQSQNRLLLEAVEFDQIYPGSAVAITPKSLLRPSALAS